ncbi:MAG: hypothetical protein A2X49_08830 [Lentisphaerae bacterium GWF2_52_8]|nr:MAG: hypothetical protein A2X49_08830 [Lentisphaerae bacterium GWF2_52_8]
MSDDGKNLTKHILIAEDEDGIRRLMTVFFEREGYRVSSFESGLHALDFLKAGDADMPDLLITDISMPGLSGLDLMDQLKRNNISIPTMIVSASQDRKHVIEALRKGCSDFLDKPVNKEDMLARVEAIFRREEGGADLPADTAASILQIVRKIGNYELLKVLGEGCSGTVFLCRKPGTQEQHALKLLRLNVVTEDEKENLIARFIQESEAISRIKHPNIVNFVEFGYNDEDDSRNPYIVMEYFDGKPLSYYIDHHKHFDLATKIGIIRQVSDALSAVHDAGICHRDVKPANILVNTDGKAKITDFGICHLPASNLTMTTEMMGSPGYMAPEYVESGKPDKSIDIYSLGVVAYELLLGRRPFESDNLMELARKIVHDYPLEPRKIAPGMPLELQDILAKMLRKDPKKRYQNASEIVLELDRFKESGGRSRGVLNAFMKNVTESRDWS